MIHLTFELLQLVGVAIIQLSDVILVPAYRRGGGREGRGGEGREGRGG